MCRPVTCKQCGKTTWAGCGQHVAQVKAGVPSGQWCPGHEKSAGAAPVKEKASGGGLLSRLLRRG